MAQHDIRVVPCRCDEVGELQHFIDQYWRRGHILARDEALLRWQYDPLRSRTGLFDGPTILLAKEGKRLVGMLGLICVDCNIRGTIVPAAWMAILLGIPEVRTKGVGLKLLDALAGLGFEAVFVLGINDQVKQIYRRLGYEILEDMPRWLGVFDVERAVRLVTGCSAAPDEAGIRAKCKNCHVRAGGDAARRSHIEIVDWSGTFARAWNETWSGSFSPRLIGTNRDAAYLSWRYVNHPSFTYMLRLARETRDGRIAGLAVMRVEQIKDREEKVLRVVEFLATPDAAPSLAQSVIAAGREHGVTFADFYVTHPQAAAPLEAEGFRRYSGNPDVPVLPSRLQPLEGGEFKMQGAFLLSARLRARIGSLLSSGDFYVTKSDGDMDRPN
jgi:GNAT superfamily N-acetyltransferase